MTPRTRPVLGLTTFLTTLLTTLLTTAVLAVPASAAPPARPAAAHRPAAVAQAAPTPPSLAEPGQVQRDLHRLDESLDRAATNELGKGRRHYLARNRMVDVWNGWHGSASYRHVRYTRSGTWHARLIWDTHVSARATAVAFCAFLLRWYPAATSCGRDVLAHFWMIEDAIDRAVSQRRCLIILTERYRVRANASGFLAGTVRCVR